MANIYELLEQINSAIYGEDVRESIHDAIEQCYEDATGNPDSLSAVLEKLFNGAIGGIGDIVEGVTSWGTEVDDIAPLTATKINSCYLKPGTWLILYNVVFKSGLNDTANPYKVMTTLSTIDSPSMPGNFSTCYGTDPSVFGTTYNGFYTTTITDEDANVTDDDPSIDGTQLHYLYVHHTGLLSASANSKIVAIKIKSDSDTEGTSLAEQVAQNTADIAALESRSFSLDANDYLIVG